jgi:hypothetical protein
MSRLLNVTVALLFVSAAANAQTTIAGTWLGETKNGTPIEVTLAVKDDSVTGTFKRNDQSIPIAEGKVSKNRITFKATIGGQTESLTGDVKGDELTLWLDRQGESSAAILKRVKK